MFYKLVYVGPVYITCEVEDLTEDIQEAKES